MDCLYFLAAAVAQATHQMGKEVELVETVAPTPNRSKRRVQDGSKPKGGKKRRMKDNSASAASVRPLDPPSFTQPLPLAASPSMQSLALPQTAPVQEVEEDGTLPDLYDDDGDQMDPVNEDSVFDPENPWSIRGDLTTKIIAAFHDFKIICPTKMSAKCRLCDAEEPAKKFPRGNNSNLKSHLRKVS